MILASGQELKEAKLVMLGSTTVGKSCIVGRLTREVFQTDNITTIGAAFLSKTIKVNDKQVKLQIWDTGGSEKYRAMAPMYFHDADAAVIVYDVTASNSFNDVDYWLKELREKGPQNIIIALAGNKSDLKQQRAVPTQSAQSLKDKHRIQIFKETSALTGENINELFTEIAHLIARGPIYRRQSIDITIPPKQKKCC